MSPILALGLVTAGSFVLWWVLYHKIKEPMMSGDAWYMRHMAYTNDAVSPPYCWRPLLPYAARLLGFQLVSYSATLLTPFLIYFYLGGGWRAAAVASMFVGNKDIFAYNVKNPMYAEGLGQLLMVCGVWALAADSAWVYPVCFLAVLCRESIGATLGAIAVFVNPLALIPIAAGGALAYFTRRESKNNRHPLVEESNHGTLRRWMKTKDATIIHWTTFVQPLRGMVLCLPWVWQQSEVFSRLSLVGFLPIWFFSLPASGVTRHTCYGFILLAPFVHDLPGAWCYAACLLGWLWPVAYSLYDESGGSTFHFAR